MPLGHPVLSWEHVLIGQLIPHNPAHNTGKPLWVSFTIEDSTRRVLRSHEPLEEAMQRLAMHRHVQAVLLNCCAPVAVTAALPVLNAAATPQRALRESGIYICMEVLATTCYGKPQTWRGVRVCRLAGWGVRQWLQDNHYAMAL